MERREGKRNVRAQVLYPSRSLGMTKGLGDDKGVSG